MNHPTASIKIESVNDFLFKAEDLYGSGSFGSTWLFRGQSRTREIWPLVPRAGRNGFFEQESKTSSQKPIKWQKFDGYGYTSPPDMTAFSEWRNRAVAFREIPDNDWECLALAQHYGLATRLLDWSHNPLVAIFFAAADDHNEEGAVYAYPSRRLIIKDRFEDIDDVRVYEPKPFDRRIQAQQGVFTFHPLPSQPITPALSFQTVNPSHNRFGTDLIEFVVPAGHSKRQMLQDLSRMGISRSSLFPDLDGLSLELNQKHKRYLSYTLMMKSGDTLGAMHTPVNSSPTP